MLTWVHDFCSASLFKPFTRPGANKWGMGISEGGVQILYAHMDSHITLALGTRFQKFCISESNLPNDGIEHVTPRESFGSGPPTKYTSDFISVQVLLCLEDCIEMTTKSRDGAGFDSDRWRRWGAGVRQTWGPQLVAGCPVHDKVRLGHQNRNLQPLFCPALSLGFAGLSLYSSPGQGTPSPPQSPSHPSNVKWPES